MAGDVRGGSKESCLSCGGKYTGERGWHIYSTAYTFDREGRQIGKYRKMHMFDIDVEGGQYYSESSVITAGDEVCVVETEFGPIGVAICYDVRFPELFRLLAKRGAKAVVMPASFNRTTGPAHWELLMRARALDQEMYVLGCAAAGDLAGSYNGWGHSIAVVHGDRSWRTGRGSGHADGCSGLRKGGCSTQSDPCFATVKDRYL